MNAEMYKHMVQDLTHWINSILNSDSPSLQPSVVAFIGHVDMAVIKYIHEAIRNNSKLAKALDSIPLQLALINDDPGLVIDVKKVQLEFELKVNCYNVATVKELKTSIASIEATAGGKALYVHVEFNKKIFFEDLQHGSHYSKFIPENWVVSCISQMERVENPLDILCAWENWLNVFDVISPDSRLLSLDQHLACPDTLEETSPLFTIASAGDATRSVPQRFISADLSMMLSAGAGLFDDGMLKRYPHGPALCQISLHELRKRDYIIRCASFDDLTYLVRLEELCWEHTRATKDEIAQRITRYPQGQLVLESNGVVAAVIYSQIIGDRSQVASHSAETIGKLHAPNGAVIQLLALNVDPAFQNRNFGDELLEFLLQKASVTVGICEVIGITRCKNFDKNGPLTFEQYIHQTGAGQDPILALHQAHGARVLNLIANYRPEDSRNQGNGVLVSYDILNRSSSISSNKIGCTTAGERGLPSSVNKESISDLLRKSVGIILNMPGGDTIEFETPVMELGLDSADLLKLQRHIESQYNLRLQSGFFFKYNNLEKVVNYLSDKLSSVASSKAKSTGKPISRPGAVSRSDIEVAAKEIDLEELTAPTDIAIVGISCRLPGGIDKPGDLWSVLESGGTKIGTYPESRGGWALIDDASIVETGGFVDSMDQFDAPFFRMTPAEARVTDPQQRVLLELAWSCLEDACIRPDSIKGSATGVYIGASSFDYSRLIQASGLQVQAHGATGSSLAALANRVSYFFDFSGPSLTIDTACSASLVAVHTAVQALRFGECPAALVGGVNLICHPDLSLSYYKAGMLSQDGRCKSFDDDADGYVRSEGAVVMLLKPLEAALKANNRVHAVIKGSAVNHGGLAAGLTVPNPEKQTALLRLAWSNAGVNAGDLGYIEAHGTGTSLGDPIEIEGIKNAHGNQPEGATCLIGSVKSNLGHLEAAAGIVGLLKLVLATQKRAIPASINFRKLNSGIDLSGTSLCISDRYRPWETEGTRIGGVSSFGSGGANAHVVVQEWNQVGSTSCDKELQLFVVSARTAERLQAYIKSVIAWIDLSSKGVSFIDFIFTMQLGRSAMDKRLAVEASSFTELREQLAKWVVGVEQLKGIWQSDDDQVATGSFSPLLTGDGTKRIVDSAIEERDIQQLALLWVLGKNLDFSRLYNEQPRYVTVPTYPFERRRFWVDTTVDKIDYHHLLGKASGSTGNQVFTQHWDELPGQLLFSQEDFSCLSLGAVLEMCYAAARRVCPQLTVASIENLRFHPFHIAQGTRLTCETRCNRLGEQVHVELVEISSLGETFIAAATLLHCEDTARLVEENIDYQATGLIRCNESLTHAHALPVDTLRSLFPVIANTQDSHIVSIPRITLYSDMSLCESVLVAINGNQLIILNDKNKPLLSILNT